MKPLRIRLPPILETPVMAKTIRMQITERYSCIKPVNSRWDNGWLISMTTIGGFEMVRYSSDRPFVLSRAEWEALPEYRPERLHLH